MNFRLVELAEPFDEANPVGVDQNVGDGRVLEQRLDRAEAGHLVDDLIGEDVELLLIERYVLGANVRGHVGAHLPDKLGAGQLLEREKIEFVDDPPMELELFFDQ